MGLETVINLQATGKPINAKSKDFVERLLREGVTGFIDKAGRRWRLSTYTTMVCRTTSRQAQILSVLTRDDEQDLYQITSHGTTCRVCAPYEGRVYSKSGNDPDFPPLADAFGKIVPEGPNELNNTWLNIHPNCLHSIVPWTPIGKTKKQLDEIKRFSSPKINPYTRDPRSVEQISAYRKKSAAGRNGLKITGSGNATGWHSETRCRKHFRHSKSTSCRMMKNTRHGYQNTGNFQEPIKALF